MIFNINNSEAIIYDPEVTVSGQVTPDSSFVTHLEVVCGIEEVRAAVPNMPELGGITSLSYEPDNGILHIVYGKKLYVYDRPEQHEMLKWIDDNKDAIETLGIQWRVDEIERRR